MRMPLWRGRCTTSIFGDCQSYIFLGVRPVSLYGHLNRERVTLLSSISDRCQILAEANGCVSWHTSSPRNGAGASRSTTQKEACKSSKNVTNISSCSVALGTVEEEAFATHQELDMTRHVAMKQNYRRNGCCCGCTFSCMRRNGTHGRRVHLASAPGCWFPCRLCWMLRRRFARTA